MFMSNSNSIKITFHGTDVESAVGDVKLWLNIDLF
jgi:hypothetical protein